MGSDRGDGFPFNFFFQSDRGDSFPFDFEPNGIPFGFLHAIFARKIQPDAS